MIGRRSDFVSDAGSRPTVRGHCPNCGVDRNAEVLAEDNREEEDKTSDVWVRSTYSILRCLGCDRRYIRLAQLCSEDYDEDYDPNTGETSMTLNERITYWPSVPIPPATRPRPDWLWPYPVEPELSLGSGYPEIASLLTEVYTALDNNLLTLVTIGIRTVFDRASQELGTDTNQNFTEKLKELAAGNKIGGEEKEILAVLVDAGSAAAHRGWKPTQEDINHLIGALENFLERAFVLKHNVRGVKKVIPARDGH